MDQDRARKNMDLFARAIELTPAERPAFLDKECGDDDSMRSEVRELVELHELAERDNFLGLSEPLGAGARPSTIPTGVRDRYVDLKDPRPGGMGIVYRAWDVELCREVAYKVMREAFCKVDAFNDRFAREAEITARLEYPGIVPVYGRVVDDSNLPAYAMAYIDGNNLHELARRPGDLGKRLSQFRVACQIVEHAHSKNFVHGDLSLKNIMVAEDGATHVVDWGVARCLDPLDPSSRAVGGPSSSPEPFTQGFTPPSVRDGKPKSLATDVYSLGAILAALAQGVTPEGRPDLDGPGRKDAPPALRAIIDAAMFDGEGGLYPTAGALADDLERLHVGEKVRAYKEPLRDRVWRSIRRHPTRATAIFASVLIALIVATAASQLSAARAHADRLDEKARLARELALESKVSEDYVRYASLTLEDSPDSVAAFSDDVAQTILKSIELQAKDQVNKEAARALARSFKATEQEREQARRKREAQRRDRAQKRLEDLTNSLEKIAREFPENPKYRAFLVQRQVAFARQKLDQQTGFQVTMALIKFFAGLPVSLPNMEAALAAFDQALAALDSFPPGAIDPELTKQIRRDAWWGRAAALMSLCRFTEALISFDRGAEFADPDRAKIMAGSRLICRMAAEFEQSRMTWSRGTETDHRKAIQLADYLANTPDVSSAAVYNAACANALASLDEKASPAEKERRASRAIALLARIAETKYFDREKQSDELRNDHDLDSLRQRADFRALVAKFAKGK